MCEAIWFVKQTIDDRVNIALLETTFRDLSLAWYVKFKSIAPMVVGRSLVEIQQALFKEFQKPKSKSKCIIEIKEIKKQQGQSMWDFD